MSNELPDAVEVAPDEAARNGYAPLLESVASMRTRRRSPSIN